MESELAGVPLFDEWRPQATGSPRRLARLKPPLSVISFGIPETSSRLYANRTSEVRTPMPISQDLLEILACPACKQPVELRADGDALKCVACHRVYPIRDDIPVMLIDEATIEDEPATPPQETT